MHIERETKNNSMIKDGKSKCNKRSASRDVYKVIDNDLAKDNIENDIPAADLNEL